MGDREYNRVYAKQRYDDFRVRKDQVSLEHFGGHCFLCGACENYEHYHLHHIEYGPDADYQRNSKAQWTREMRLREAEEHPERFRLLCPKCHRLVTTVGNYLIRQLEIRPDVPVEQFLALATLELNNRLEYVV